MKKLIRAISGMFQQKKISIKEPEEQMQMFEVTKSLISLAEASMPAATGAEKHKVVATALAALVDIPGLNEEAEEQVIGLLIQAAGLAIGLFKKRARKNK